MYDSFVFLPQLGSSGPALRNSTMGSMEALVPFIFQLPPTKNLRPILEDLLLLLRLEVK